MANTYNFKAWISGDGVKGTTTGTLENVADGATIDTLSKLAIGAVLKTLPSANITRVDVRKVKEAVVKGRR